MSKLEVNNLTISFRTTNGAVRAVRDISFSFEEGETLAIVGESGSGKSVTTRAIMGILAGNAMVDGGEIIYDGKDLLKIPEDEFHNLRGHKLAMVFQDPLSALNPIMRIGKQLTEAMLLNNKERRRDGRKSFNSMLKTLKDTMHECGGIDNVDEKIATFDKFTKIGVDLEFHYEEAKESLIEAQDCVEEIQTAVLQRNPRGANEACGRLIKAVKMMDDPYLLPHGKTTVQNNVAAINTLVAEYRKNPASEDCKAKLNKSLDMLAETFKSILDVEEPNFFRIGYAVYSGKAPQPGSESIHDINEKARQLLDDGFMLAFRRDVEKALAYSEKKSNTRKAAAVQKLDKAEKVFSKEELDLDACKPALNEASSAVAASIDPLQLDKNSQIYVYRSSARALLNRYRRGFSQNQREQNRYALEKRKYDQQVAAGKQPASVIPMNLIDQDAARRTLVNTTRNVKKQLESEIANGAGSNYAARAEQMIDYLKARASDYAYKLSKGMARHRAIELMKEVGIPEPHKRYKQYPFEFSGGMRQRIVIAIALSANPDILICDEPTTALDVTIQAQILELINRLKRERKLSVIFITHDLGVVANMADKIAIMYAGKIVEYGTADEVFYDPRHPYTWALLSSMPDLETKEKLEAIPGTPPDMILPPEGDAFAARNKYAMRIDFEQQPPAFKITDTHWAATWLLHPNAPHLDPPAIVTERIQRMKAEQAAREKAGELKKGGADA